MLLCQAWPFSKKKKKNVRHGLTHIYKGEDIQTGNIPGTNEEIKWKDSCPLDLST